jgi:hypothetical protein
MREDRQLTREPWVGTLLSLGLILGLVFLLRLGSRPDSGGSAMTSPRDPWLKFVVGYVASGAEIVAAFVIGAAALQGLYAYARDLLRRHDSVSGSVELIRFRLGRALALGLEFTSRATSCGPLWPRRRETS